MPLSPPWQILFFLQLLRRTNIKAQFFITPRLSSFFEGSKRNFGRNCRAIYLLMSLFKLIMDGGGNGNKLRMKGLMSYENCAGHEEKATCP